MIKIATKIKSIVPEELVLSGTSGYDGIYVPKDQYLQIVAGVCFCSLLVGGFVGFILGTVI